MARMDRPRRKRFVIALTIGLLSVAACILSGPLIVMSTMPAVENSLRSATDIAEMKDGISAIHEMGSISNTISGITLFIAVVCFVYCFFLWASSFIGPPEETAITSGTQTKSMNS